MKPWWIAIALVLAAGAVFYWLKSGDAPSSSSSVDNSPTTDHRPPTTDHPSPSDLRSLPRPELPISDEPRTYTPGAGLVRDHRGLTPNDERATARARPPSQEEGLAKMDVQVVVNVSSQVRPIVHACADSIPDSERSDKAILHVRMTTSVQNGALSVETVTADIQGAPEHPEVVDCIKQRAASIRVTSQGHGDLHDYPLTFPYRLSPKS